MHYDLVQLMLHFGQRYANLFLSLFPRKMYAFNDPQLMHFILLSVLMLDHINRLNEALIDFKLIQSRGTD